MLTSSVSKQERRTNLYETEYAFLLIIVGTEIYNRTDRKWIEGWTDRGVELTKVEIETSITERENSRDFYEIGDRGDEGE